jgi:hypothetical protein
MLQDAGLMKKKKDLGSDPAKKLLDVGMVSR